MVSAFGRWLRRGGFFAQLFAFLIFLAVLAALVLGGTKAVIVATTRHNAAEGDLLAIRGSYHDARAALDAVDRGDATQVGPLDAAKKDLARDALRLNATSYDGAAHLARAAAAFAFAFDAYEACLAAGRASNACPSGAQQEAAGKSELHAGVMQAYLGDDTL